jgi:putative DNA-invertase from lambdoid prophage Rac
MKTGLYARVSTKDQNCQLQLGELRQYCTARGWEIAGEYVDNGVSGRSTQGRKQFQRLMQDALARKLDCVLVCKLDRFGRSVPDLVTHIKQLDSAAVRFIAINQGLDTDSSNPTSRLLLNILGCVAEFERDLINERTRAGLRSYQEAFCAGKVGKGSRNSKSGKNLPVGGQQRVFDREKARVLRGTGLSYRTIAAQLGVGLGTIVRTCSTNFQENAVG